ncbi:hypothetical protein [Novosphingobium sp.]|uniref:hypothetical protein n=1 Tax=Novosphingobium sp. TaxID=1874826 RepID=UPI002736CE7A|nr:hypothetical protein [Novosphingobium sp.]MDP3906369.1 hypothetical protein [Novosphingobium sp.]
MPTLTSTFAQILALASAAAAIAPAVADSRPAIPVLPAPTYADLADLADGAPLVIRVQPRKLAAVEPERARGVRAGWGRFYVEGRVEALVSGRGLMGEQVRYLVDLPLDAKGKPPAIRKKSVVIFARTVAGRPGELQLVAPDGQLLWDTALDARLRSVLGELLSPGAPQRITGVREAIHVTGTLAGEGETQVFLSTASGDPAAATIARTPGQPARISVSFSELVGTDGGTPPRDSLAWYRLACFLAPGLPAGASISGGAADRAAASADYRALLERLGPCPRTRK